ncbi:MAG: CheR family methyltransferase, partial [Bradymonadaceae bacterium]
MKTRPEEVRALLQDLLISVTGFSRDPEAFETLNEEVVKPLVDEADHNQSIRIWVPACATGEEAYSLAILFLERARERGKRIPIQIFATDIDERALQVGRAGHYPEVRCAGLPPHLLKRYFLYENGEYQVVSTLRDTILFARHDMLKDAPFARLHLMSCRNLLIYLKPETQRRVFEIAYYALKDDGVLFLGQSESPEQAQHLFTPVDKAAHVYRSRPGQRVPLPLAGSIGRGAGPRRLEGRDQAGQVDLGALHHRIIGQTYAPPSVLINDRYEVLHVLGDVHSYLKVPPGRPSMDLLTMVKSELRLRLRTACFHVFKTGEATDVPAITLPSDDEARVLQIHVQPVKTPDGDQLALVVFDELARPPGFTEALLVSPSDPDLRLVSELEDELNHARQQLQVTIEEYDASNEELSTANEELMAMNEELQSTGEELETSKEELQSVNEELTTFNEELHNKNAELDTLNSDLRNLLSATRIATIFLDLDLRIKRYTQPVTAIFNMLPTDVGRPIDHVTHELKYQGFRDDAARVLETRENIEHEVNSEDGRWFVVRLSPYQAVDDSLGGVVVTFFDVTARKESQEIVEESERRFRALFESARDGLFVFQVDEDNRPSTFQDANNVACEQLGLGLDELRGMTAMDLVEDKAAMEAHLELLSKEGRADSELTVLGHGGARFHAEFRSRLINVDERTTVLSVSRDITERKRYDEGLLEAQREAEKLARLRASFLTNMSHEIRTPLTSIIGLSQLLARELGDRESRMAHLIQSSGKRLLETINSVLDLARIEAGEMTPYIMVVEIVSEVEETVDILRTMAEGRGLDLSFHSDTDYLEFRTDKAFIDRIVYNLVGNAIKFTEAGSIKVEVAGD